MTDPVCNNLLKILFFIEFYSNISRNINLTDDRLICSVELTDLNQQNSLYTEF